MVGELAAERLVESNDNIAAKNQVQSFIRQVNALVRAGQLSAADGQRLISAAESITAMLGQKYALAGSRYSSGSVPNFWV